MLVKPVLECVRRWCGHDIFRKTVPVWYHLLTEEEFSDVQSGSFDKDPSLYYALSDYMHCLTVQKICCFQRSESNKFSEPSDIDREFVISAKKIREF